MKNLIREVHRRSLWQVLGIYLAGSWVALQVVEQLTEAAGLPEWVRPFSLVLLVLGFPIVMATAFVQEGMAPKTAEPEPETPADVADAEPVVSEPEAHHRLFTWKNALLGGAAAFTLLGLLTAGYLFMRSSGIGPAGTLVAQGILEEGAPVVLADFAGPDDDLAAAVSGALQIDLFQSPTIRVVPRAELTDALARMERSADDVITSDVARELAVREGYGAVIEGEIAGLGSGYVLTARIVGGEDWAQLAAFRETARSEDDLIDAIEALSRSIRDKSGESLRSVQGGAPLYEVTTGSLEALQLYSRGELMAGDDLAATELFERATEIDPEFAMAHRKLATMLFNAGVRPADRVAAYTRAYELRDRLPDAERYLAEADYEDLVSGDRNAAIRAFESLLEIDPENTAGLNNLGLLFWAQGRLDEAEDLFTRAVEVVPFEVAYLNQARVNTQQRKLPEMHAALDSGRAALPEATTMFEDTRVWMTISNGDYARASELAGGFLEAAVTAADRRRAAVQSFVLAAIHGRLDEAERHVDDFDLVPGGPAHPMREARIRSLLTAARGDSAGAVRELLVAYESNAESLSGLDMVYEDWLRSLVNMGGAREAASIYDAWKQSVPESQLGADGRDARLALDAELAGRAGRHDDALQIWDELERRCPGYCAVNASLGRARVHDASGDRPSAIRAYEDFLADPTFFRQQVDTFEKGPALQRLAELYDAEGDAANAIRVYEEFVALWTDADDVLQPRVNAARQRVGELQGASE
jgi:tetratricopeptide (TPR) repeat protein